MIHALIAAASIAQACPADAPVSIAPGAAWRAVSPLLDAQLVDGHPNIRVKQAWAFPAGRPMQELPSAELEARRGVSYRVYYDLDARAYRWAPDAAAAPAAFYIGCVQVAP